MANLSKIKRDRMIEYLKQLKRVHSDDESIIALNEIENALKEKKFGLVFEKHSEEMDELLSDNIPILNEDKERRINASSSQNYNFLIEGDNLQALYLLNKTHRRKIDCIYIDPPYNTGAKDWKYNNDYVDYTDNYRHSKWLSMMERRLSFAKFLLKPDGVMIVAIDDYEMPRLIMLIEELFQNYDVNPVIVNHHPQGGAADNVSRTHEYALFVIPKGQKILKGLKSENFDESWSLTRGGKDLRNLREGRPNSFFAIYVDKKTKKVVGVGPHLDADTPYDPKEAPQGCVALYPVGKDGRERVWRYERESMLSHINDGDIVCSEKMTLSVIKHRDVKYSPVPSLWLDGKYNAGTQGTNILTSMYGSDSRFSYPKSLYTVVDCIKFCTRDKPNALVLDFFAGSGTTMHAVQLLNAEDGGNRKCILVTNNELSEKEEKKLTEQGLKKGDPDWEKFGIAKYVTWPRIKCVIDGKDVDGNPLKGTYLTENGKLLNVEDGLKFNLKYFKCDWITRKPTDYLLSNALCMHIRELLELQNFIEIDNKKNVLVLNKNDYLSFVDKNDSIERVWYNQNIIFSSQELAVLKKHNAKPIPKEFFGEELKEAGE